MTATELATEIMAREQRALTSESARPQYAPRASAIGKCPREMYYQVTAWDKRPPPDAALAARFRMGNVVEHAVVSDLRAMGFTITGEQTAFQIKEPYNGREIVICTGTYEGRIALGKERGILFEIKSLVDHVFDRVNRLEDFTAMGDFWQRYPKQLLAYAYHEAEAEAMYILRSLRGETKCVPIRLEDHLEVCEQALQDCRTAAIGIAEQQPPAFCTNPVVCMKCWARQVGICAPPMDFSGSGVRVVDDPEVAEALRVCEQAEEAAGEYDAAKKIIDEAFKARGAGDYIVGEFSVTTREGKAVSYKVPPEIREPFKVEGKKFTTRWERVSAGNDGKADAADA